jgi:antirestriction protein ArdC
VQRIDRAETFFAATGATFKHGDRSYYNSGSDHVQMPHFEAFRNVESYCAILAHKLTHWTKHPTRLDRDFGRNMLWEELVAEPGAAFLSADLDLTPEPRSDRAAYILA